MIFDVEIYNERNEIKKAEEIRKYEEQIRIEKEKAEKERIQKELEEKLRIEKEIAEKERIRKELEEKIRIEKEEAEKERMRIELEIKQKEMAEKERIQKELEEKIRIAKEEMEKTRIENEKKRIENMKPIKFTINLNHKPDSLTAEVNFTFDVLQINDINEIQCSYDYSTKESIFKSNLLMKLDSIEFFNLLNKNLLYKEISVSQEYKEIVLYCTCKNIKGDISEVMIKTDLQFSEIKNSESKKIIDKVEEKVKEYEKSSIEDKRVIFDEQINNLDKLITTFENKRTILTEEQNRNLLKATLLVSSIIDSKLNNKDLLENTCGDCSNLTNKILNTINEMNVKKTDERMNCIENKFNNDLLLAKALYYTTKYPKKISDENQISTTFSTNCIIKKMANEVSLDEEKEYSINTISLVVDNLSNLNKNNGKSSFPLSRDKSVSLEPENISILNLIQDTSILMSKKHPNSEVKTNSILYGNYNLNETDRVEDRDADSKPKSDDQKSKYYVKSFSAFDSHGEIKIPKAYGKDSYLSFIYYNNYPLLNNSTEKELNFTRNAISIKLYDSENKEKKFSYTTESFIITFPKPSENFSTCSFFDVQKNTFSNENCFELSNNKTHLVCSCNHLTDFFLAKFNPSYLLSDVIEIFKDMRFIDNFTFLSHISSESAICIYIFSSLILLFAIGIFFTLRSDNKYHEQKYYNITNCEDTSLCCNTTAVIEAVIEVKQVVDKGIDERKKTKLQKLLNNIYRDSPGIFKNILSAMYVNKNFIEISKDDKNSIKVVELKKLDKVEKENSGGRDFKIELIGSRPFKKISKKKVNSNENNEANNVTEFDIEEAISKNKFVIENDSIIIDDRFKCPIGKVVNTIYYCSNNQEQENLFKEKLLNKFQVISKGSSKKKKEVGFESFHKKTSSTNKAISMNQSTNDNTLNSKNVELNVVDDKELTNKKTNFFSSNIKNSRKNSHNNDEITNESPSFNKILQMQINIETENHNEENNNEESNKVRKATIKQIQNLKTITNEISEIDQKNLSLKWEFMHRVRILFWFVFKEDYWVLNLIYYSNNILKSHILLVLVARISCMLAFSAIVAPSKKVGDNDVSSSGYVFNNKEFSAAVLTLVLIKIPYIFFGIALSKSLVSSNADEEEKKKLSFRVKLRYFSIYFLFFCLFTFSFLNTLFIIVTSEQSRLNDNKEGYSVNFYKTFAIAQLLDLFIIELAVILIKCIVFVILTLNNTITWWKKVIIYVIAGVPFLFDMFM